MAVRRLEISVRESWHWRYAWCSGGESCREKAARMLSARLASRPCASWQRWRCASRASLKENALRMASSLAGVRTRRSMLPVS